jgi:glutamyl-tRNA reductase
MNIELVGIDYKMAGVEVREKISFPNLDQAHQTLIQDEEIHECLIVSTCNRSEIYAVTSSPKSAHQKLRAFFYQYHDLNGAHLDDYFYHGDTTMAVNHLMRVTSSLEAMIVGEPQITGQVKTAYRSASVNNCIGKLLHKLIHASFKANKEIRSATEISVGAVSVSFAACKLAQKILSPLTDKSALIIGAGEMMRSAAGGLSNFKIGRLAFSNRTDDNAHELSAQFQGTIIPFDSLQKELHQFDICFCAASAPNVILTHADVEIAMRARKNAPFFMVDLSVPRMIDPEASKLLNVFLYNIDDLKSVVADNQKKRNAAIRDAREIVKSHAETYLNWLGSLDTGALLGKLATSLTDVRDRELLHFDSKLKSLPTEDAKFVRDLSNRLVKKIFYQLAQPIKEEKNEYEKIRLLAAIEKIFKLS